MGVHPDKVDGDALKVELSPTSVALDVKGRGVARALDALVDLISPFTSASGWLGDQLTFARRSAAIRAAARAREQLKREGIVDGDISPKILLPWLEGASLETEETDSLTDAWAGLFVRAAKSSDAVVVSYIETLRKLGKREAELLQFFATDTAPFYSQKFYNPDEAHIFSERNPLRDGAISRLERLLKNEKGELAGFKDFMEQWGIQGMCQIIFFSTPSYVMMPTPFFEENEHAISNLEHLGLVTIKSKPIETASGTVEIVWLQITKYAFDMIWACQGVLTGKSSRPSKTG